MISYNEDSKIELEFNKLWLAGDLDQAFTEYCINVCGIVDPVVIDKLNINADSSEFEEFRYTWLNDYEED